MLVITKDLNSRNHYIIDHSALKIVWCGSSEACEAQLRYLTYRNFWFSLRDREGREITPTVCSDSPYKTVFRPDYIETPHNGIASGWWEKEIFHNANGTLDGPARRRFWACYLTPCAPAS